MRVTINGEINLEVECSADISSSENAHNLKVTARVKVGDAWIDVDVTTAVSKRETKMILNALEDQHRTLVYSKGNFGRGEAV
jgi:hypothetical protein